MLNPGDMFSVDQRKVLWATGAPKPGRIKVAAREGEGEGEGDETATGESVIEEAPDPVTPDEAAAEAKRATEVPVESDAAESEFVGKKGPEKRPWTKHDDPNNPIDVTKPYATPWRPRDYLPPFAFIPRYLEARNSALFLCSWVY